MDKKSRIDGSNSEQLIAEIRSLLEYALESGEISNEIYEINKREVDKMANQKKISPAQLSALRALAENLILIIN